MGERLYPNVKRITNIFCLAIVLVTLLLFTLRLTALSGMVRDPDEAPEPVSETVEIEGTAVSFRIRDKINFDTPTSYGNIAIENSAENDFYMRLEIFYDISGRSIYLSPFLKPGEKFESARLQGNPLAAGTYGCTAVITAYDPTNRQLLQSHSQPITVHIGARN